MLSLLISVLTGLASGEVTDTIRTSAIVADRGVVVSRTDTLPVRNSLDVTEALGHVPGLLINDNGGSAGLKTVSLRGLGSPHTVIYVDGVRVGNVQSGQPDLGMLGIENFDRLVVDYAQNSISFRTAKPHFANGSDSACPVAGRVLMRAGSFGTYEPSARLDFRLSDRISLSANAAGTMSRGDFPYGDSSTGILRRENNDIRRVRGGIDVWGLAERGEWHAKAWYNGAERGTPGSADWPSTDRQKDRNAFVQGLYRKNFTSRYSLNLSAKASYDDMEYLSEWGDSRYGQTEFQLNSSHRFAVNGWLSATLAADVSYDALKSTGYGARRTGVVVAAAAAFSPGRFRADVNLEFDGTYDGDGKKLHSLSPSVDIRFRIDEGLDLVAFARRAFRVPTFNELYYPGYGNAGLNPEDAWLTDAGVEWHRPLGKDWSLCLKADAFYNRLKDKITSAPSVSNPAVWIPYNIGVVSAAGADVQSGLRFSRAGLDCAFTARYSFQNAVDRTPDSYSFGSAIPYVARHTVTLDASFSYGGWSLSTIWNYRGGRCDADGEMPDWNILDFTAGKDFHMKATVLGIRLTARNVADCRYELSGGYPMPGRSFMGGLELKF